MKNNKIKHLALALVVLLLFTACNRDKEGSKTPTATENENNENGQNSIRIEKIDRYEKMEITDWLDEGNVILAKENLELRKMSLVENSEFYPRSLYQYNLETQEYKLIRAQENMFLGGAKLSPDKRHLVYYEYSIGDTAHYLMDMESEKEVDLKDEVLGLAISAQWTDSKDLIGPSYAGGAYLADTDRNFIPIQGLEGYQLLTVQKVNDSIYYVNIEGSSMQLYKLNIQTKETLNLEIENVDRIIPSPDGKQLLLTQWSESTKKLLIIDEEGTILKTIAEGSDITGPSWSPNQSMIAYHLKSDIDGEEGGGLYIYDVITGNSNQVKENIDNASISWSPSGEKIALAEYSGNFYNSYILYLK